jgi:hypothetical protein
VASLEPGHQTIEAIVPLILSRSHDEIGHNAYAPCGNARLQRVLLDAMAYAVTANATECGEPVDQNDEHHLAVNNATVRRAAAEARMREQIGRAFGRVRERTA